MTFEEDPLRMLRAAQFAARFAYDVGPQARAAMIAAAPLVRTVSPERVCDELTKLFAKAARPSIGLEVLRTTGSGRTVSSLVTQNLAVQDGKRWPLLEKVLATPSPGGTILFTNTREQCDTVAEQLREGGYRCGIYRGEMDKAERRTSLRNFREGKFEILVSTDLAGRGLDLSDVGRVINYHLPQEMDNYLHRVGRTARAGRRGLVVNLVTERDERLLSRL